MKRVDEGGELTVPLSLLCWLSLKIQLKMSIPDFAPVWTGIGRNPLGELVGN